MIRLPDVPLPAAALRQLADWQDEVNAIREYSTRIKEAVKKFRQRNTATDPTFLEVRRTLTEMCSGAQRCCYCEDSAAVQVEHIWPKSLYPELVFAWHNYLYACGSCNNSKNNRFALFPHGARKPVIVIQKSGVANCPPSTGKPVLIDPRQEDPMDFLLLDLQDTFHFRPVAARRTRDFERAEYTLDVLGLNKRTFLPVARINAFETYCSLLSSYVALSEQRASPSKLNRIVQTLNQQPHTTVWREMQRQHRSLPELEALFLQAPEALHW